jgi:hypothetical protein
VTVSALFFATEALQGHREKVHLRNLFYKRESLCLTERGVQPFTTGLC